MFKVCPYGSLYKSLVISIYYSFFSLLEHRFLKYVLMSLWIFLVSVVISLFFLSNFIGSYGLPIKEGLCRLAGDKER